MSAIPQNMPGQSGMPQSGEMPGMQQPGQRFDIPEPNIEPSEYVPKPLAKLHGWIDSINIAKDLKDDFLNDLGAKVIREYEIDESSREEWKTNVDKAMKIARQVIEKKNFPWVDASNVKYPLVTVAAIQFAARAYPEIIKGNDVVKCRVKGEDPKGEKKRIGERVADHMSWQLTEEMEDWEEDTDRLLHVLPIVGFLYRKTYFSPLLKCNVSEVSLPDNVVVHYKTKNLKTCRRLTEILTFYKNDIREFIASGLWLDPDIDTLNPDAEHSEDEDPPYEFLEQHRWIDLDNDGYEEPFVVTVHKDSQKVVRIVARFDESGINHDNKKVIRIEPIQYYTKIPFIPALDGSFYDIGFGVLLNAVNESVNTLINQLLDSGTMANTGGGFVSNGIQLGKKGGGTISVKPNEWKVVNAGSGVLKDAFFPFPVREPSDVLFKLLVLLIQAGKDIAQTQEVNLGGPQPGNTPAATSLMQVEQGQQVYGSIFKRIYRAFKTEFKKIFELNIKYGFLTNDKTTEPSVEFHFKGKGQKVFQKDYKEKSYDIVPVADPKLVSDVQRIARMQATMAASGRPHVKEDVLTRLMLETVNPEHASEIMMNEQEIKAAPPPLPIREIMIEEKRLQLEELAILTKAEESKAKMHKAECDAILALAKAKDISDSDTVERLEMFLKQLDADKQREHEMQQARAQQQSAAQLQDKGAQAAMQQAAMKQAATQKTGVKK
jgi:chaperonin GroES